MCPLVSIILRFTVLVACLLSSTASRVSITQERVDLPHFGRRVSGRKVGNDPKNEAPTDSYQLQSESAQSQMNLGVVSVSKQGVKVKPQMKFGGNVRGASAEAGIHDVRDGLKGSADASIQKTYRTHCSKLPECFKNVAARTKVKGIDHVVTMAPRIVGRASELLHMNLESSTKQFVGKMAVSVTYGVSASLYLGWKDTGGWHMIGAGGKVANIVSVAFRLRAGWHTSRKKIRIAGAYNNVLFDFIGELKPGVTFNPESLNEKSKPETEFQAPAKTYPAAQAGTVTGAGPATQTTQATHAIQAPTEQATPQMEQTKSPTEQAQSPTEQAKSLTEEAKSPTEQAMSPTQQATRG